MFFYVARKRSIFVNILIHFHWDTTQHTFEFVGYKAGFV